MTAPTCRYLVEGKRGSLDRCTAEAADPDGEIMLCTHHLALVADLAFRVLGEDLGGQRP